MRVAKKLQTQPSKTKRDIRLISGIFLTFIGILLLLAFVSYLFTWKVDFSANELIGDRRVLAENILNKSGAAVSHFFIYQLFGWGSMLFPYLIGRTGITLLINKKLNRLIFFWIKGLIRILWISIALGFFHQYNPKMGGVVGYQLNDFLIPYIGVVGLIGLLFFVFLCFFIIEWNWQTDPEKEKRKQIALERKKANQIRKATKREEARKRKSEAKKSSTSTQKTIFSTESDTQSNRKTKQPSKSKPIPKGQYDPKSQLPNYSMPSLSLLNSPGVSSTQINQKEIEHNKLVIQQKLDSYNLKVDIVKATVGPTVTLYELVPEKGVRIGGIQKLEKDIALALSAIGIRIIAPIPGKGTVGIEVPNKKPTIVPISSILSSQSFQHAIKNQKMELPIAVGKTVTSETFVFDLAKMPHLLIAGATGQGKSVGINTIVVSILYQKHPEEIKFVMIDPKMVELKVYSKIYKHYLAKIPSLPDPVITDYNHAKDTLKSLCVEMKDRYELLKKAGCRNVLEYNNKIRNQELNQKEEHRFLPYIILVIDEFADLILATGKEVENAITSLAQLSRAVGIHLIIATQRPSVNVITGLIKANFPARIAFKVVSATDSRTILDQSGANQLIGRGDMLFTFQTKTTRIQCAYIGTSEVERVVTFINKQRSRAEEYQLPEIETENELDESTEHTGGYDALFVQAAHIVVQFQKGSISLIQRKLKIGFNRAGRIVDQLERARIVSSAVGSKPREVLIASAEELDKFLANNGVIKR